MPMNTYGLKKNTPGILSRGIFFGKQTRLWEEKYFLCLRKTIHLQSYEINPG